MISRSRGISPGMLAPASTTRASASSGAPRIVSGTPTRLFRLPPVACTRYAVASTARIISLVLVFPLEPVIATTGLPGAKRRRRARANRPSAASVSSTSKNGSPATAGVPRRTTAAAAPLAFAWSRNACASKRSPFRATNKVPGVRCRVSVSTPVKCSPGGPGTPKAPAIPAESQRVIAAPSRPPQLPDHLPLVEVLLLRTDHLVGLVPLSGEQHRIARPRELERAGDGPAAVGHPLMRLGPHARLDLIEDPLGILRARVVRRRDRE